MKIKCLLSNTVTIFYNCITEYTSFYLNHPVFVSFRNMKAFRNTLESCLSILSCQHQLKLRRNGNKTIKRDPLSR